MRFLAVSVASTLVSSTLASDWLFRNLLNTASQAPLNINSFAFVYPYCDSDDSPDRPEYCQRIAKGLIQATEAYTSVIDIPRKIHVAVTVNFAGDAENTLAKCSPRNLVKVPRSSLVYMSKPAAINDTGVHQSGRESDLLDMGIVINVPREGFHFAGEGDSLNDRKFDFAEIVLHELTHGLGFSSEMGLQVYQDRTYLVPQIRLESLPGMGSQQRIELTVYDEHIQSESGGFVAKRDMLKLAELLAPNGQLPLTIGHTQDFSQWPEAALQFSEKIARHALEEPLYFKSDTGKLYQLNTDFHTGFWGHLHQDYESGANQTKSQDYLMATVVPPKPYAQTLEMLYGNASLPVSRLIGPGLRDILTSIGWRLR